MRPEEWLSWILDRVPLLPATTLPLHAAAGLVLADRVFAHHDLPLWPSSAMDGFAVRASDLASASPSSPICLDVVGEVTAGSSHDPVVGAGRTVRIMTGAPLPGTADAVLPIERAAGERGPAVWEDVRIRVDAPVAPGAHVRQQGEDVRAGQELAGAGDALTAVRTAALAAAGITRVPVRPQPRVAVLTTGSELTAAGEPLRRGLIPESNSLLLAGLLRETGIAVGRVEHSDDDVPALRARLSRLSSEFDAVITTGGVGPGMRDVLRLAVETEEGVRAAQVAVKPGRPQCAGLLPGGGFLFALPGNPVSAAVSFELFVRPALLAMQGSVYPMRMRVPAVADTPWRGSSGRLQVLPVRLWESEGALRCAPVVDPRAVSHVVGRTGAATGFALVGEERGDVALGEAVAVLVTGR